VIFFCRTLQSIFFWKTEFFSQSQKTNKTVKQASTECIFLRNDSQLCIRCSSSNDTLWLVTHGQCRTNAVNRHGLGILSSELFQWMQKIFFFSNNFFFSLRQIKWILLRRKKFKVSKFDLRRIRLCSDLEKLSPSRARKTNIFFSLRAKTVLCKVRMPKK
jgi:hypothetical protein